MCDEYRQDLFSVKRKKTKQKTGSLQTNWKEIEGQLLENQFCERYSFIACYRSSVKTLQGEISGRKDNLSSISHYEINL